MTDVTQRHFAEFIKKQDKLIIESLRSLGIHFGSMWDDILIKKYLKHIIYPKLCEELWMYKDIVILEIKPLEWPSVGFKFIQHEKEPPLIWWKAHPGIGLGTSQAKTLQIINNM